MLPLFDHETCFDDIEFYDAIITYEVFLTGGLNKVTNGIECWWKAQGHWRHYMFFKHVDYIIIVNSKKVPWKTYLKIITYEEQNHTCQDMLNAKTSSKWSWT